MKKYIMEFIGTFFLLLTIVMVTRNGTLANIAPLAIGCTLIGIIFAGGHISRAHYNPAVTLAFFMSKKINLNDSMGYILAQIIGAIFATFTATTLLEGVQDAIDPKPFQMDSTLGLAAEFIGTFFMVFVILNVAIAEKNAGNGFYGVAIGFVVSGLIYVFGPVSGAAFNPAVALGLCACKSFDWQFLWVYLLGSLLGAAVASVIFRFLNDEVVE